MVEFLQNINMMPFTATFGILVALLLIEVASAFTGLSLFGSESDGVDLDFDAEADIDLDVDTDLDLDAATADGSQGLSLLAWLGIGRVPTAIWGATALASFGLSGTALQLATQWLTGGLLPAAIAIPLVIPPAILITKRLSLTFARAVPKTETTALARRSFAGNHGTITQGTAQRGKPAEVRLRDRHGNLHHLRLEPYDDAHALPQGTDVYVTRTADGTLRLMPLSDD